jgi:hypothetical protein
VQRDLTTAQKKHARNYEQADMLLFRRGAKSLGIGKGQYATVESIDSKNDALNIITPDGRHVLHPGRLKGLPARRMRAGPGRANHLPCAGSSPQSRERGVRGNRRTDQPPGGVAAR